MLKLFVSTFFVLIYCFSLECDAARILAVFPAPSISHQVVFRPLTQALAKRGHELVILTPDPAFPKGQEPANVTEIDTHDISYDLWIESCVKNVQGNLEESHNIMVCAFNTLIKVFEAQINTKPVQELIRSKQRFDLIFTEACVRSALVMAHVFNAPVIQISSLGSVPDNFQVMGAPSHPVFYPEFSRKRIYNLSVWEKIIGAYEDFQLRYLIYSLIKTENEMLRRNFGPDVPSITELSNNIDMLFLNVDPIWDGNRPVPPGVIYLGGLHQKPQKELPTELKTFLDGSKHGVIYMSLGTNVRMSLLPPERIQVFMNVFSKSPFDVLLKWDTDDLSNIPKNVKVSQWLPQSDLLRHPKVKLFITQAGLQSTDEALTAGVPLVAFPMLGDQWYNAEKYVHHGIGVKLDIATVTEETLTATINQVIEDERYRDNIQRLGMLMRDRPQSPLERAVWWTEYVIRHGGAKHLHSASANVSWTDYLMLDVVAVISSALLLALLVIVKLCFIFKRLFKRSFKVKSN